MMKRASILAALLVLLSGNLIIAADRPDTRVEKLNDFSEKLRRQWNAAQNDQYIKILNSTDPVMKRLVDNPEMEFLYVDENNKPVFYEIDNVTAAQTISTNQVWPGGFLGLDLDGSGTALGMLGIWDGGGVLTAHQEFDGRVTQMDGASTTNFHATHVAGTMVASGLQAQAKGMSHAAELAAYDWNYDNSEMAAAAANGLNVSNHSYGFVHGWRYDDDWYWWGNISISDSIDYGFGFYSDASKEWDSIAYYAPYYTIVKSAGNDRNDDGPGPGGGHYAWIGGDWTWNTETRSPDGGSEGFDCIGTQGVAKNIITVGAINDLPGGYSTPTGVSMSSFSSWGPTDDGRIKPDLVANGTGLYSPLNDNYASYGYLSGTSMSSPNLSGSLNLLVRQYENIHGVTPLASTMKAVLVHTADEAGPDPGPDYMYGWGLANIMTAGLTIRADSSEERIIESSLSNGATESHDLSSNGNSPITLTVAWTDPPGTPPAPALNPTDIMLVNDLDIRLEHTQTGTIYYPYILDPANPSDPAATGDNIRDNVEKIFIASPQAGDYIVTVSHKGTLASDQSFSLVSSHNLYQWICGDANGDLSVNLLDINYMINFIYNMGPAPIPESAADVNNDGDVNLLDIVVLISYLYKEGPAPNCP